MASLQVVATLVFAAVLTGALKEAPVVFPGLCQTLVIASSDEKFAMLRDQLAAPYNSEGHFVDGRCARVSVEHVNSGDAEQLLENRWSGTSLARPDVWSPASSAWIALLKHRAPSAAGLIGRSDSLFQSPTVIAMPAPMAKALDYPGRALGWSDIFDLVNNPSGWGSVDMPQWGKFKLAKTNPTISTSGLHALIGTYKAAGATTEAEVASQPVRDFVGKIESSVVHYAPTASAFLTNLADADNHNAALDYMSAVVIEEQEMVAYNATSPARATPLVAIYPKDGTPVDDHPYVLLSWSTVGDVADDFYRYVIAHSAVVDANFFRDSFGNAGFTLSAQAGISPVLPFGRLAPPSGAVLDAMLSQWQTLRKRARVLIVVDAGAGPAAVTAARELGKAVSGFQPTDEAGVWVFPQSAASSAGYTVLSPLAPYSPSLERTLAGTSAVPVKGNLDDVVSDAVASMSAAYSPSAIDAVLVVEMAPGPRTAADKQLESELRSQPADRFVRIFTVGPSSARLEDLALAGRGGAYEPGGATHFLNDVIGSF